MDKIKNLTQSFYIDSDIDSVAVAVLDFKTHTATSFEIYQDREVENDSIVYFDYASLSKPLTNSLVCINEKIDESNINLLINHQAGLPSWGLLSHKSWKEQILSYSIKESETLYSDFSALRAMLEIEKLTKKSFKDLVMKNLKGDIKSWLDLTGEEIVLQNGYYHQKPNIGKVHDPNAYNLRSFTSHAGLFGTVDDLAKTLLEFDKEHNLLKLMNIDSQSRFVHGFDTVSDPNNTLAGSGCSNRTFGHLGFTGTSFWIDPELQIGHIILSNATKHYWFAKNILNEFRREVGQIVWSGNG